MRERSRVRISLDAMPRKVLKLEQEMELGGRRPLVKNIPFSSIFWIFFYFLSLPQSVGTRQR